MIIRQSSAIPGFAFLAAILVSMLAVRSVAGQGIVLDYNGAKLLGNVDIAGGAIDLTSGAIIVTTSSFGFVPSGGQADEYMVNGVGNAEYGDAAIHNAIVEGANFEGANFDGGYWNGTNGIISSVAANDPNLATGVGWIDLSKDPIYTSYRGVSVSPSESIIGYTYYGDVNLDGVVNSTDLSIIDNSRADPPAQPDWSNGDTGYEGAVDTLDLDLAEQNVGRPALFEATTVPEPGTNGLAIACGLILALGVYRSRGKSLAARRETVA